MKFREFFSFKGSIASLRKAREKFFILWTKDYSIFFMIFFLCILGITGYSWYQSFYNSDWSPGQKNQYMTTQEQKVNLKEGDFKKVIDEVTRRSEKFQSGYQPVKDIFKPY